MVADHRYDTSDRQWLRNLHIHVDAQTVFRRHGHTSIWLVGESDHIPDRSIDYPSVVADEMLVDPVYPLCDVALRFPYLRHIGLQAI